MKILSKMLSKKIDPKEPVDLEDDFSRLGEGAGRANASRSRDALFADPDKPIHAKAEEPDVAASGWEGAGDWDDDWDDDDDWGDEDLDPEERRASKDKQHLVSEIREAMVSVSHVQPENDRVPPAPREENRWADDEDFGRRARARSQLTAADDTEDRILEKTEDVMSDRETSRRRSAMAHMKAAAAATKADRVLRHVASRDPSADPEEQSPYRDDLAKVVRPHSKSRPISRQVSRPNAPSPVWDQGEGDEDAALFAAAEDGVQEDPAASVENELAAAEAERLARTPAALSEEDFADDFESEQTEENDFPSSRFATKSRLRDEATNNAFDDLGDDDFADEFEDADDFDDDDDDDDRFAFDAEIDDHAPRPSSVVSEAVAFANAPDEEIEQPEEEVRKKIWEMADEVASEVENVRREAMDQPIENIADITAAAAIPGRAGRSAGRVKTRLLGFQADDQTQDVFEKAKTPARTADVAEAKPHVMFPVGFMIVTEGPGLGACFTLVSGVSKIGRGAGQEVRLDFGDTSISRDNHAAVAYDEEQAKFFLGHGGKSNLVRKNGMPVLSTEELEDGDVIRIGETVLKFVALNGEEFTWLAQGEDSADA